MTKRADDPKKPSLSEGTKDATAIVGGALAIAGAVGGMTPVGLVATAGGALLPRVAERVIGYFQQRSARRQEDFVQHLLSGGGEGLAVFEKLADGNATDAQKEAIVRGVQSLANAISDQVVPHLAVLSREYASRDMKTDWFFRSTTRFLSDLTDDEIHQAIDIFRAWLEASANDEGSFYYPEVERFHDVALVRFRREHDSDELGEEDRTGEGGADCPDAERIFRMLVLNGLADEPGDRVRIHCRVAAKLASILLPGSGAQFFDESDGCIKPPWAKW